MILLHPERHLIILCILFPCLNIFLKRFKGKLKSGFHDVSSMVNKLLILLIYYQILPYKHTDSVTPPHTLEKEPQLVVLLSFKLY